MSRSTQRRVDRRVRCLFMLLLAAAVLSATAVVIVPEAAACSCVAARNVGALWPVDGASDVPIDTPIVFRRL